MPILLPTSVPVGLPPLGALTLKFVAPSFGGFRLPFKLVSDWFAFSSLDGLIVIFLFICLTLFDEGLESDGQSESAEKEHPPVDVLFWYQLVNELASLVDWAQRVGTQLLILSSR